MIKIYPKSKIYILCPAATATGGPELLHQLCYKLRSELGADAYMYYYPGNILKSIKNENPLHNEYKKYGNPYTYDIEDKEINILISPEVGGALNITKKFNKIRKIIWFLGLDCYFLGRLKNTDFLIQRITNIVLRLLGKNPIFEIGFENINIEKYPPEKDPVISNANMIVTNSYRGINFLQSRGLNPVYLSEYLNENFLKTKTDLSAKENVVTYNPKKGFGLTQKIIKAMPDINFIPIKKMTRQEVIKVLQKSKVYIDFGNHSGKDRLPREAAILECCVITGKRGSAGFYKDVSIPDEYKFEDHEKNIPLIVNKIRECLQDYNKKIKDFEDYKKIVLGEPSKFTEDIKNNFS